MRVIYVSGPYRGKVRQNITIARTVAIQLWEMGYAVICPHSNTGFFPEEGQIDYIKGDLEFIERLIPDEDSLVMLPNWEKSEGSKAEKEYAEGCYLKIWYWPEDKDKLKQFAQSTE